MSPVRGLHTSRALVAALGLAAATMVVADASAQPAPQPNPPAPAAAPGGPTGPGKARPGPVPGKDFAGQPGQPKPFPRPFPRPKGTAGQAPHGAPADAAGHGAAPGAGHGAGHGACPGLGPEDRPPGINLMHGWLGVNNEKAVPAPAGAQVGSGAWWLWRLTPYPWRYKNEADKCDLRNQPVPLLAPIINFAILAWILWRFGRKPLREGLRKRATALMAEIEAARAIKQQARERLRSYEDEIAHLDETAAALREKHALEAEAEKTNIITEAGLARDRMLADASFRVAQEAKGARDEISRKALEGALVAAEQLIQQRVSPQDVDRIAEEYLEFVGPALREQVGIRQGATT